MRYRSDTRGRSWEGSGMGLVGPGPRTLAAVRACPAGRLAIVDGVALRNHDRSKV
jgi:hypothetical protein